MIYRGVVTANNSPTKDGRVQVRIFQIHGQNTKDSDLPWAEVMQGIDFIGFFDGPKNVQVAYDKSSIDIVETPNSKKGYGKNTIIEIGTWVFCVFDHDNVNMPIVIGTIAGHNEINTLSNPKNQVTRTVAGHIIEIDDNPGNERIHIHHKSGTDIEIMPDGTINLTSVKDVNTYTFGKTTNTVVGTHNEIVNQAYTETYNTQSVNAGPSMKLNAGRIDLN